MTDASETNPAVPATRRIGRQVLIWAIKIVVSGGLLYVLLSRVDLARLWNIARTASFAWLAGALLLYLVTIALSSWRWGLLLAAQHIQMPFRSLVASYLVATFFNNFLPSNIGGDVIRIGDTAKAAKSKTLATTIVLVDRGIGLLGLVFVAAVGASVAAWISPTMGPIGPGILWAGLAAALVAAAWAVLTPEGVGALLRPLRALHQEWVEARIQKLTTALARFREAPSALATCFIGSILVQAGLVGFYAAIARGLHVQIPIAHLAIVVPVSFVVQMLPVSVNGLGVRETTFVVYLAPLGLPRESALALSLISAVLIMVLSTTGAVTYLIRRH